MRIYTNIASNCPRYLSRPDDPMGRAPGPHNSFSIFPMESETRVDAHSAISCRTRDGSGVAQGASIGCAECKRVCGEAGARRSRDQGAEA